MNTNNQTSPVQAAQDYPCVFSVVMAVYNCEPFLRETLDSIVSQNIEGLYRYQNGRPTQEPISFEELVEVIMVDDGSKDASGAICDEYAARYSNFRVIHKENGGVASARNEGLKHVRGKYMNFLDSDDTFSENVLREIYAFFEANYEKTDVVTMPLQFFDAVTGPHWQNYKFRKEARIANLFNEYNCPLMFVNASFFKSQYKDKVRFNGKLVCGEDIRFICEILAERMTMGLVPTCYYGYRRRSSGEESLVQSSKKKPGWYFDYFEHLTLWAVEFCKQRWGYIPYYYQHIIVCDLQWRFLNDYEPTALAVLGEADYAHYKETLYSVLKHFDDAIILGQRNIWNEHKCMMLSKKYGHLPERSVLEDDVRLRYGNTLFCTVSSCFSRYEFLSIRDGNLRLEGVTMLMGYPENASVELFFEAVDPVTEEVIAKLPCRITDRDVNQYRLDEVLYRGVPFCLEASTDLLTNTKLRLVMIADGDRIVKKDIRYGKHTPVGKEFQEAYYYADGYLVTCDGHWLCVRKCTAAQKARQHRRFLKELSHSQRLGAKKASVVLRALPFLRAFKRKPLFLISDRVNKAGDNGEAMFRYLCDHNVRDVDYVFAIEHTSPDYDKVKKIGGRVVDMLSFRYKLTHLLADCIISSHADDVTVNPFTFYSAPYRNILSEQKYIFLQHGVTQNDMSEWLNRFNKNITGLICAAKPEADSFEDPAYSYAPENIWRTGFPRFDRLYHDDKRYVTIMPTWRMYLSAWDSNHEGVWKLAPSFLSSTYFKFYDQLINDQRLIDAAKKNGYTLCFMPHPNVMSSIDVFRHHPDVQFFGWDKEYRDIYAQSSLVLTDYSSAVFDFAYLRKPVVYTQFDWDEMFAGNHVCSRGYFDYEKDGFGEVVYDYEATVALLVKHMETGCRLSQEYRDRIDRFFLFDDQNNCQRVYEKARDLFRS
ncbi:MAG: CDP-glycerol glycerophosphotransferase family protein [Clostridia bacterium]|nr:CDP-glycerol glycerophosphotransferase family protein [Clostridia bacterium]